MNRPFSNYDSLVESATFVLFEFAEPTIKKLVEKFKDEVDERRVREYLGYFERFKASLAKKDPFQYKTFQELEHAVDEAQAKRNTKKGKKVDSPVDTAEALVDDDDVQIFKGDEEHKCVKYGQGYSFCISRPGGGNMFSHYRTTKASTFYFIFFKKTPKTDPKHIMVLDRTDQGWEWTFANNSTQETTWEEIIGKFPVLKKHERLFGNNPFTPKEKKIQAAVDEFIRTPNMPVEDWNRFDYEEKMACVKSGMTLGNDVFSILDSAQRNAYVSVGTNLTAYQASSLKESEITRYKKFRAQTWKQLFNSSRFEPNLLDLDEEWFKKGPGSIGIRYANNRIQDFINFPDRFGDLDLSNIGLMVLPEGIPKVINGSFYCNGNNIVSLKGSPKVVKGGFSCSHNMLLNLEGGPERVSWGFDCSQNHLTSLKGGPVEVGGDYDCGYNRDLKSAEGAPKRVEGDFYGTKAICDEIAKLDCVDGEVISTFTY